MIFTGGVIPLRALSYPLHETLRLRDDLERMMRAASHMPVDAVQQTLVEGLNTRRADPQYVRSLTYFPHCKRIAEIANWYERAGIADPGLQIVQRTTRCA